MSSSSSLCYNRYQAEVDTFETLLFTSLGLTAFNIIASRMLVARQSSALKLAYYHVSTGLVKLCLAIGLFATIPTCPSGCNCVGGHVSPAVALIPLALGCVWLHQGCTYFQKAKHENAVEYSAGTVDKVAELT